MKTAVTSAGDQGAGSAACCGLRPLFAVEEMLNFQLEVNENEDVILPHAHLPGPPHSDSVLLCPGLLLYP